MVIHADSSFLIDLLREQARRKAGSATAFLEKHASDHVVVSMFVVGELEAGAANASSPDREQARVRALLRAVDLVFPDERFARLYGETLFKLRKSGTTMDAMDLLIATAAMVDGASLVTNQKHFAVVPGLKLLGY